MANVMTLAEYTENLEEILDNFDLNEEIITSQTLKPKKKNYEQSLNTSQENDFQIIESYCLLSGQKNDLNDINLNSSIGNNLSRNNYKTIFWI